VVYAPRAIGEKGSSNPRFQPNPLAGTGFIARQRGSSSVNNPRHHATQPGRRIQAGLQSPRVPLQLHRDQQQVPQERLRPLRRLARQQVQQLKRRRFHASTAKV